MFGYVKICRPDMKIREYEVYKSVYCSLCHALGKRYGILARMTLSYDFTFLALFLMALHDEELCMRSGRCVFHPLKKRSFCYGDAAKDIDRAADIALLLTYHKLSDTVADERFFKRVGAQVLRWLFRRDYRRACERCPKEAFAAQQYMEQQSAVERNDAPCVDAAAEPTAKFLSSLIFVDDDTQEDIARFTYCLGRFIYLCDAADDLESDLKHGRFNPYIVVDPSLKGGDAAAVEHARKYAAESLHANVAVCAECYERLPIKRFDGILRNIIYGGMPLVIRRIADGKQEGKRHEESL